MAGESPPASLRMLAASCAAAALQRDLQAAVLTMPAAASLPLVDIAGLTGNQAACTSLHSLVDALEAGAYGVKGTAQWAHNSTLLRQQLLSSCAHCIGDLVQARPRLDKQTSCLFLEHCTRLIAAKEHAKPCCSVYGALCHTELAAVHRMCSSAC